MADEHRALHEAQVFERYWDTLLSGRKPRRPAELDPEVAEMAQRVHALGRDATVNAAFQTQLLEDIMQTASFGAGSVPLRPIIGTHPNGTVARPRSRPRSPSPSPWRRLSPVLSYTVTAAFITLVGALVVFFIFQNNNHAAITLVPTGTPITAPVPSPADSWPMYRGDPGRTGNLPVAGPAEKPVELWHVQTGGQIDAARAVVNGVLYIASEDGNVHALDAKTGAQLWKAAMSAGSGAGVVVEDGVLYVTDHTNTLYAFDAATGKERWHVVNAGETDPGPVVDGVTFSGGGGVLHAIDVTNGQERWSTPLGGGASRATAYADGLLAVGSKDGYINALDPASGVVRWRVNLGGGTVGTPSITGGVVYASNFGGQDNKLLALKATDGTQLWAFQTATKSDIRSVAVGDGSVYTVSGDGNLYALDAATGVERFHVATGGPITAAPALASGVVYVVSHDLKMYAVDGASGKTLWTFNYGTATDYGPVIAGGNAYLGTNSGAVIAVGSASASGTPVSIGGITTPAIPFPAATTPANAAASPIANVTNPTAFAWQTTGGPQPLTAPGNVSVAPDGRIWVSDGPNGQFQIFAPDGTFVEAWGVKGAGDGQVNFYRENGDTFGAIAFASDGSFYVADEGNFRIQKFDKNRHFLFAWGTQGSADGQFLSPSDIAIDANGNIFVDDDFRNDVQKFDANGKFLLKFGGGGSSEGQLNFQGLLALDSQGNVWVADGAMHRIQSWDNNGKFRFSWTGDGQLQGPLGVAVDDQGRVFVSDADAHKILVLDTAGHVLTSWGSEGTGQGQFTTAADLALDGQGNLYVVDMFGTTRLEAFRLQPPLAPNKASAAPTFEFVWLATGDPTNPIQNPYDIVIDPHGTLWVTDARGDFQLFDLDGNYLETWGTHGSGNGQFNFVRENGDSYGGVAFGRDGSIYVVDTGNLRVQKFDALRHFVSSWGGSGTGGGQFLEPLSIAVNGQGQVFVLDDLRDDVQVFDANGAFVRKFRIHETFGLATNQSNSSNQIMVDTGGNVYVTSILRKSVLKFDPSGKIVAEIGGPGTGDGQFKQAEDVVVNSQGDLFVSDGDTPGFEPRVEVFAADGTYLMQWGSAGTDPGKFSLPTGLVVHGQYVYVADDIGNRVQKFKIIGQLPGPNGTPVAAATPTT